MKENGLMDGANVFENGLVLGGNRRQKPDRTPNPIHKKHGKTSRDGFGCCLRVWASLICVGQGRLGSGWRGYFSEAAEDCQEPLEWGAGGFG